MEGFTGHKTTRPEAIAEDAENELEIMKITGYATAIITMCQKT